TAPIPAFPRMRGKEQGLPSRLHARDTPSPARGGGLGWGQGPTAAPQVPASDTAPPRPSPACGGRSRACPAASTPVTPSPARGGGSRWGQSPPAAPHVLASDTAPPRPSPACGGRSRACPVTSTPVTPPPPPAG